MKVKYIFICLVIPWMLLGGALQDAFTMAERAYEQGMYNIAQVYLENLLQEEPLSEHVPDATYYLIQIYNTRGDLTNLISYANRFLFHHKYDLRCPEVFGLLLERLSEKEAYTLAYDYVKKYDYFVIDFSILENIGYGLFKQNRKLAAEHILSLCPQTDTIKIVRAQLQSDSVGKVNILKSIDGIKGDIYLIENYLEAGDTINAYEVYRNIPKADGGADLIYRFTKIALLFENTIVKHLAARLEKSKGFSNKRILLEALATGYLDRKITPIDEEEMRLLIRIYESDTISTTPPEGINFDSLLSDTTDIITVIEKTRNEIQDNYYLDSFYCEMLIDEDRIEEADRIMSRYLNYFNVRSFVRSIRARRFFKDKDYQSAMNDIILSNDKSPDIIFLLAECSKKLGKNPTSLYAEVVGTARNSALYYKALQGLIESEFANRNYKRIIEYTIEDFQNDTNLIKIYVKSLTRIGEKVHADSIFHTYFSNIDYEVVNYYGEFLIDSKKYLQARNYYDSIVHTAGNNVVEKVYYNWALVPFLQGKIDTALVRFNFYIDNLRDAKNYYNALFKVATINYLQEDYDSAGYYYGLASKDSSLQHAALQNQLICYKKVGYWALVVEVGTKLLALVSEAEEADVRFDIGYAFLRAGRTKQAISNLEMAAWAKSVPEHYYWLGEAYFSRGDLVRALYRYQKIVDFFPKDNMWVPTAQYKTGVVFEYMDELDAARKVYKEIIKKRGVGDIWSVEAQKRLEELEW